MQMIEAVPNISEGRNAQILHRLVSYVSATPGVRVLHVDSNADANRTVLTLAGQPQAVVQGLFSLFQAATQFIDMRHHHGEHPRLGVVDVCPLVPLGEISLAQTAAYAGQLARQVAQELQIPVYLYEANARTQTRSNLAFIRRGEYENLPEKLHTLPPDYGPQKWNEHIAKTGATVIGARNFLIAFNMSLNTQNVQTARHMATQLREKDGGLKAVKAIGWYMPHYGCAQVSCNLTDYTQTGLAQVFETCKKLAAAHGVSITAGELVGMVPQNALAEAGKFYLPNETNTATCIEVAVKKLLLDKIHPFTLQERVLEYQL